MREKKSYILGLLLILLLSTGCSVQRMAIRSLGGVLDNSMEALYEEKDLELAEKAIASDLKLLEGLIKSDPGNDKLLLLAAQGFTSYALGFVEDESPERARDLYLRGRNYGLRILKQRENFERAIQGSIEALENMMGEFDEEDVPALFWTANSWGNWINLSFTNTQALADLPRVQLLMERVIELDESYFYGGAHLFFGSNYAARPAMLGGDIEKSRSHFERCFEFAGEKFLLPYYYYARYYATRQFDESLFENTLVKILDAPNDILPEQNLPNAIAKNKAAGLLKKKSDLF